MGRVRGILSHRLVHDDASVCDTRTVTHMLVHGSQGGFCAASLVYIPAPACLTHRRQPRRVRESLLQALSEGKGIACRRHPAGLARNDVLWQRAAVAHDDRLRESICRRDQRRLGCARIGQGHHAAAAEEINGLTVLDMAPADFHSLRDGSVPDLSEISRPGNHQHAARSNFLSMKIPRGRHLRR